MPFTALHRLLGKNAGPVTEALLDEAVAAQLAETDDLDWKAELPPTRGLAEADFPKDVAAMANSGGGTIVYGVTEDEKQATGRADVGDLTENHERALRAAAFNVVVPPVFGLEIVRVGGPGHRAVVVVISPSSDAPHLIYRNQLFGAPVRNNADTEWMKERQVEAAYRARLDGQRRAVLDLNDLWEEVRAGLPDQPRAQLVGVARPRTPLASGLRPSREEASEWLQAAYNRGHGYTNNQRISATHPLGEVATYGPRPGLRRWVAQSTTEGDAYRYSTAEVHHDGVVALSSVVGGQRAQEGFNEDAVVEARAAEATVADFMAVLRVVGEARGIAEYDVQLGFIAREPIKFLTFDQHFFPYDPGAPVQRFVPVRRTVRANSSTVDFHWEVHDVAEDVVNQGGVFRVHTIIPPARDE